MKKQTTRANRLKYRDNNEFEAMRRYRDESLSAPASWLLLTAVVTFAMLADSIWAAL